MDIVLALVDYCVVAWSVFRTSSILFMPVMNTRSGITVQVRTDRTIPFYEGDDNPNVDLLRDILVTYSFYNFDLGYCQVNT